MAENFDPKNTHCIEVAASRNKRYLWQPTQETLRGRWSLAAFPMANAQEALQKLSMVGDIPGIFIQVDTKELVCRTVDPLEATKKGRELFRKIEIILKEHTELFGGNGIRVIPERLIGVGDMDRADKYRMVKTWTYWMRRALISSKAVEVSGFAAVPSLDDIRSKMPGDIDNMPTDDIGQSNRFRHYQPLPGEKPAATGSRS